MNQGGNSTVGSISQLDPNLLEKHQVGSANHAYTSVYSYSNIALPPPPPTSVPKDAPWTMHRTDNNSTSSGIYSNSSYHHDQQSESLSRGLQDGLTASSHAATSSSLGAANGPHEYSGYTPYSSSTDPYGYGNTRYQGYHNGYQQQLDNSYPQQTDNSYPQQTDNAYPQQVGGHQNSGAPYQSLTSFQNSGSYAGSTSYSSTYYNTGDYQTTGSYSSSSYSGQTNSWNDGNYASYQPHQYSGYTPADSNSAQTSGAVASTPLSYEQHCKQWADYYSQTASDVTCAPGTERTSATTTSTLDCQIAGISGGYPISNSQPPQPGTTSWRPESSSFNLPTLPTLQVGTVTGDTQDSYWRHGSSGFQSHHASQIPSTYQNPLHSNPVQYESSQSLQRTSFPQAVQYESSQSQQRTSFPQGPNIQLPATHHGTQTYQSAIQTIPPLDTRRATTLQIPTNPRIASSLALGLPNSDKDASTTDAVGKPAYISVSVPIPVTEVSSYVSADLKPGTFPSSLRAYVERALARCKDDSQKAACQNIMKEMITKASSDGTLFTQDWDIEPLFPLPDINLNNMDRLQISTLVSSLPKYNRSPSRRFKSRWEPIAEEKLDEKLAAVNHVSVNDSWDQAKGMEKVVPSGKLETKATLWNNSKFFQSRQQGSNKNAQRPVKKPRLGGGLNAAENGDASSDTDKEHDLTAYYSGAIALANSPEEKKKRENRFKRFDRGHQAETKHFRLKAVSAKNVYTGKASAMVVSRIDEDSGSRAVEDIDWDSLTVKGTCQEVEKRYLRLTSAPDPSTVRPEEVLDKALLMVQNSQKNYLYKCDQLKSIRQDLTVQRIHNELTVKVYETHARLALEAGDLPEFNQCQSQLQNLYADGIKGCNMEFSAYSLLCVILHSNNNRDLVSSMARLSIEAKQDEAIKHALAVRSAVTSGNYVLFFRLYKTAPYLSTCLMDLYVEKMRYEAVKCMSRSYRPTVPLPFIAQVLGFTSISPTPEVSEEKDTDGLEECEEWLKAHGACLVVENSGEMQLDTKASSTSLYMPEPEDAVAHGDTTLAVNDFLTRTS